tara:strand:+ start:116 stop:706 length:591 start_codon:yes stop_codon:yes gene_type:complete
MTDKAKNEYQHNDDGTTFIFIESKNKYFPGKHTVIIDTEDWDMAKGYRWSISTHSAHLYPYAATTVLHPDGGLRKDGYKRMTTLKIHHLVLGKPPKGKVVDHRNHNGLDNRKDNLRVITQSQNLLNRRSSKNSSSKHRGVSWRKTKNKWRAQIKFNKKPIHIGYFTCEKEAARAYNKKALELWGDEHVLLNEVEDD